MKNFETLNALVMNAAIANIESGVNNDIDSEMSFIRKSVVKTKNAYDAKHYGINGKCYMVIGFGYAMY